MTYWTSFSIDLESVGDMTWKLLNINTNLEFSLNLLIKKTETHVCASPHGCDDKGADPEGKAMYCYVLPSYIIYHTWQSKKTVLV